MILFLIAAAQNLFILLFVNKFSNVEWENKKEQEGIQYGLLQQIAINTVCINIFILGIHDVFLGR
jgi:hypothetical protein